jgi:superfamily II DNA helicase RecQ
MDNKTIRRVVVYDVDDQPTSLWQKVGRACRDGNNGTAIFMKGRNQTNFGKGIFTPTVCLRESILSKLLGYIKRTAKNQCTCKSPHCSCNLCSCCTECAKKCSCRCLEEGISEDAESIAQSSLIDETLELGNETEDFSMASYHTDAICEDDYPNSDDLFQLNCLQQLNLE